MDSNLPTQESPQGVSPKLLYALVIVIVAVGGYYYYNSMMGKGTKNAGYAPERTATVDTTPKTHIYKPLDSIPLLNDCAITQESKAISGLPYVRDFTSRLTVAGTVDRIEENTTNRMVIQLKTSDGTMLTIPYIPIGNADLLSAKIVTDGTSAAQKSTISAVKVGDLVIMTLQCRLFTSRNQNPGSRLETVDIIRSNSQTR